MEEDSVREAFGRVSLAPPFADAHCALRLPPLPDRHARCFVRPHRPRQRRVLLATALRAALVAVLASLALRRLRRLTPSPRLGAAALRAPVPAQVQTPVRALPPPCCARPRAAPAALPPAQSPRRLRRAALAGDDFPNVDAARLGRPDRRGGLGSHTRRIVDAEGAVAAHVHDWLVMPPSLARVSAPGVPETIATDRCSQPSLDYVAVAAPSYPCRTKHLSGFRRVAAYSLEISCKHL